MAPRQNPKNVIQHMTTNALFSEEYKITFINQIKYINIPCVYAALTMSLVLQVEHVQRSEVQTRRKILWDIDKCHHVHFEANEMSHYYATE